MISSVGGLSDAVFPPFSMSSPLEGSVGHGQHNGSGLQLHTAICREHQNHGIPCTRLCRDLCPATWGLVCMHKYECTADFRTVNKCSIHPLWLHYKDVFAYFIPQRTLVCNIKVQSTNMTLVFTAFETLAHERRLKTNFNYFFFLPHFLHASAGAMLHSQTSLRDKAMVSLTTTMFRHKMFQHKWKQNKKHS